MHPVATALNRIGDELNRSYLERQDAVEAALLALLSKEHVFLYGPPGVAKSALIRDLAQSLTGASYFECALSKTRPAEAVLGPLNIKEFRENGNYFLKRKGFATDSQIVFLDEIGKMSPVVGHDLLALLNERVYHEVNGGNSVHEAPLHTAFTAANEIPTNESDDAAALYDRLLLRTVVDDVKDKRNFAKLLTASVDAPATTISFEDVKKAAEVDVPALPITKEAVNAVVDLRIRLNGEKLYISPRRWRASMKVLQARAFLSGDTEVREEHLSALRFTLWTNVEEVRMIEEYCQSAANPFMEELLVAKKGVQEIAKGVRERSSADEVSRGTYGNEAMAKLKTARDMLDELLTKANGRSIPGFDKVADLHRDTLISTFKLLGFDDDVAEVAAAKKLGLGGGSAVEVEIA